GGTLFNAEFGIRHRAAPYRKGQVLHSVFAAADNKNGTVQLVATLGGSSGSAIKGAVITVSRDAQGVWSCNITKTPAAWKPNYAPANCPKS
ncbi:pilin, partial [Pseudomonas aeruginosa]|uniref:pilin n=1 Tax=Pseudomonas aeruginosa TaxID=287 RepID=UPI001E409337